MVDVEETKLIFTSWTAARVCLRAQTSRVFCVQMLCPPPQNKELIFLPNIFLPQLKLNQMWRLRSGGGGGKRAAVVNTEFITHWSRFSYEMPPNLRPGERSRVRTQYHCLCASVFIRHFLSAVKGRLECFTVSTGWDTTTLYDSVVMDWSAVCSQDSPSTCDRLTEALTHEHNLSLRRETIYHPLWVPSQWLTASGDCSQRWAAMKKTFALSQLSSTGRQIWVPLKCKMTVGAEGETGGKPSKILSRPIPSTGVHLREDMREFSPRTPQTHVCVQRMDQHISRA